MSKTHRVLTGINNGVKELLRLNCWLWASGQLVMNRVIEHHEVVRAVGHVVWYLLRRAGDVTISE